MQKTLLLIKIHEKVDTFYKLFHSNPKFTSKKFQYHKIPCIYIQNKEIKSVLSQQTWTPKIY